jgi:hypothetical protein
MFGSAVAGVEAPPATEGLSPRSWKRNPRVTLAQPLVRGSQPWAAGRQQQKQDSATILRLARQVAADPQRQGLARLELLLALAGCPAAEVEARRLVQGVAL